jgi:heat shock protein HspQ
VIAADMVKPAPAAVEPGWLEQGRSTSYRHDIAPAGAKSMRRSLSKERVLRKAKFSVGQIVRHRLYPFRGVIFDVDPTFNNSEEWYQSIPADRRPSKDQPFYHLLAQNAQGGPYEAYVSEQNLLPDAENGPVTHPMIDVMFEGLAGDRYVLRANRQQ